MWCQNTKSLHLCYGLEPVFYVNPGLSIIVIPHVRKIYWPCIQMLWFHILYSYSSCWRRIVTFYCGSFQILFCRIIPCRLTKDNTKNESRRNTLAFYVRWFSINNGITFPIKSSTEKFRQM